LALHQDILTLGERVDKGHAAQFAVGIDSTGQIEAVL